MYAKQADNEGAPNRLWLTDITYIRTDKVAPASLFGHSPIQIPNN